MSATDIKEFESQFGKSDLDAQGIATLRQIITDSGAPEHVETLITNLTNNATQALETTTITTQSRQVLSELAIIATKRNL
jgi:geranylgeranyl diphosphate synthase type I